NRQTEPPQTSLPAQPAHTGSTWGLDLTHRDLTVKPGDDFYLYANGHWQSTHQIPQDRPFWDAFSELEKESEQRVQNLIQFLPEQAPAGSAAQKVGDFYRAYLDTQTIERLGLEPARPTLNAIDAASTHEDIARLIGRPEMALESPVRSVI